MAKINNILTIIKPSLITAQQDLQQMIVFIEYQPIA